MRPPKNWHAGLKSTRDLGKASGQLAAKFLRDDIGQEKWFVYSTARSRSHSLLFSDDALAFDCATGRRADE